MLGRDVPGAGLRRAEQAGEQPPAECPDLQRDLNACRQQPAGSKKLILLSLGGGAGAYQLNAWTSFLASTPYSKNARVYLGLPGSAAAAARPSFDLNPKQAADLIAAFYCRANLGGVAVWDATYARANVAAAGGKNFYQNMKSSLLAASLDRRLPCTPK